MSAGKANEEKSVAALQPDSVVMSTVGEPIVTAELICTEQQGKSLMDGESIFSEAVGGPARNAATVPRSDALPTIPLTEENMTVTGLVKQNVGPTKDAVFPPVPIHAVKLPSISRDNGAIFDVTMKILADANIVSIVESMSDVFGVEEQTAATTWMNNLRTFNTLTKTLIDGEGFAEPDVIPFHPVAIVSLLMGKNKSRLMVGQLIDEFGKIRSRAIGLSRNRIPIASRILAATFKSDAAVAQRTYITLLYVSNVDGLCKVRAGLITQWLKRLHSDVDKHFEIIQREMQQKQFQNVIRLQAGYDTLATESKSIKLEAYADSF